MFDTNHQASSMSCPYSLVSANCLAAHQFKGLMMSLQLDATSAAATSADISAIATSAVAAAALLICSYLPLPLLAAMFQSKLLEKAAPSLLRRNHSSWQIL